MTGRHPGEAEVRAALIGQAIAANPGARIVTELGLAGRCRVDLAVIAPALLAGFEIKTGNDRLTRLAGQVEAYSGTLDLCCLVAHGNHLDRAVPMLPPWWGVYAVDDGYPPLISAVRGPEPNPAPDPAALAALLWRDEAATLAAKLRGYPPHTLNRATRSRLQALLADIPYPELRAEVCTVLAGRQSYRWAMRLPGLDDADPLLAAVLADEADSGR